LASDIPESFNALLEVLISFIFASNIGFPSLYPRIPNPTKPNAVRTRGFVRNANALNAPITKAFVAPTANIVPIIPAPTAIAFQFFVVQS